MKRFAALISQLFLCLVLLSAAGCTQFPVLKTSEGWAQLAQPPQDEKEVLAAADQDLRAEYGNSGNTITWFQNSDGEYLIYVRNKAEYEDFDGDGNCSDETYRFKKSNGIWAQQHDAAGLGHICVD